MYNYKEALKEDISAYIYEAEIDVNKLKRNGEAREALLDELWVADSVTGNGCGSYYCNAYKAEEALCHNLGLLEEAMFEFGCDMSKALRKGAEYCDVTIRLYLLNKALNEVIEDWEEEE